jgi:hypothetical protein
MLAIPLCGCGKRTEYYPVENIRVINGETFYGDTAGHTYKFRIDGITAPTDRARFAPRDVRWSKTMLAALLSGGEVLCIPHRKWADGSIASDCVNHLGRNVATGMLAVGAADKEPKE